MSDRIVSVLLSTPSKEALDAAMWLDGQEILPRALLTLATSFRYVVGEQWAYDAIQQVKANDDDDEKATS